MDAGDVSLQSRMHRADYDAIKAISITRLKEIKRSPLHYQWLLANGKHSPAMTLGTACHVAVLEPERFERDFAVWTNRTDSGRASPRNGKVWDSFAALHAQRTILTYDEAQLARAIALVVRSDETAMRYLCAGEPEVSMQWTLDPARACKGRIDWLTNIDGAPVIVGLKSTRDCNHFTFGAQAARLGYHMQWAFYRDGFESITGKRPRMVEIVVESEPPHAVATFNIPSDIIEQGNEEYLGLLNVLDECEERGMWPGPVQGEQDLTLPTWAYTRDTDDITGLGISL